MSTNLGAVHTDGLISYSFRSADLDAQLELQVAQHLLDGALHLLVGNFGSGVREGQGEGHALLALAEVCAAINIEQLDLRDEGACLPDRKSVV